MNIILVSNKSLNRAHENSLDCSYYNFYIPLLELGHNVLFYDTVRGREKSFKSVVKEFQPDLIFCILTGNLSITPYEPLEEISNITNTTNIKTFNWFCDDTWRFDSFNKVICKNFTYCSTPERKYILNYKGINYDNILLGNWHCNEDLFVQRSKNLDVSFAGAATPTRINAFNYIFQNNINFKYFYGLSYEDVLKAYASSKIGLNLTINDNDLEKKTQMKLRIFEIVASKTFLLTEHVDYLEEYFEIGSEIETFRSIEEAKDKIKFYLNNEKERELIANAGHQRFLKDHTSKKRLSSILNQIFKT